MNKFVSRLHNLLKEVLIKALKKRLGGGGGGGGGKGGFVKQYSATWILMEQSLENKGGSCRTTRSIHIVRNIKCCYCSSVSRNM